MNVNSMDAFSCDSGDDINCALALELQLSYLFYLVEGIYARKERTALVKVY